MQYVHLLLECVGGAFLLTHLIRWLLLAVHYEDILHRD